MGEKHRLRKGMFVVAIVLSLLVGTIGLTLHFAPSLQFTRVKIESIVESALRADLEIGDLGGSPFGELSARDVALSTTDGLPVARIDGLKAGLHWGALLKRDIEVDVQVDGLDLYVERGSEGAVNLLSILPPTDDEPSSGLPVSLDLQFDVQDLDVVWRDRGARGTPGFDGAPTKAQRQAWSDAVSTPETIAREAPHTAMLTGGTLDARLHVSRQSTTDVRIRSLGGDLAVEGITARRDLELRDLALRIVSLDERTTFAATMARLGVDEWLTVEDLAVDIDPDKLEQMQISAEDVGATVDLLQRGVPEIGARQDVALSVAATPDDDETLLTAEIRPGDSDSPVRVTARLANWLEPGPDTTWSAALVADALEPSKIVSVAEPFHRGTVFADIRGQGIAPDQMTADVRIGLQSAEIERYRLKAAYAEARLEKGDVTVRRLLLNTPYVAASGRADFTLADGTFDVRARARSADDVAEVARKLFGREVDTRADARVELVGQLDLKAADPLTMVRTLDGSASWTVREFTAEDVRIKSTTGRATVGVQPEGVRRRVRFDVDASGRSIRSSGMSLGSFSVKTHGSTTVEPPSFDPRNVLGALTARLDVDIDGLVWEGSLLRSADLLASVRPRAGRLAYDISGSVAKASLSGTQVDDAAVRLVGDVKLGRKLKWPGAVVAASARGDASLRGIKLDGDSAGQLTLKVDVAGPLDDLGGDVGVDASDLAFAGYRFKSLGADLRFTGDREFRIDARGEQVDKKPTNLSVFIRGRYRKDLTDFTILEMRFASVGDAWELSEGFSIDTRTGTMRFDDVTLSRGPQRIRVDGMFQPGKRQDLRIDAESVNLGELQEQFGLDALEPLEGWVSAEAELGGTARNPTAQFTIHLIDLYWAEFGPFEVVLEGRYGDRQLMIERVEVDGYGSRLVEGNATLPLRIETSGAFEVLTGEKLDLFLEAEDIALAEFHSVAPPLAEWGIYGGLGYRVKAKGTLEDPILQVRANGHDLYGRREQSGKEFEVGPARLEVAVDFLSPKNPRGGFDATASLAFHDEPPFELHSRLVAPVDDWLVAYLGGAEIDWGERLLSVPFSFSAKSEKFDIRNVRLGALRKADAEGFVSVDVNGEGTLQEPKMSVNVELEDFGWERYRDVVLVVDADVDTAEIDLHKLTLEWDADDILSASGTIPTPFEALFGEGDLGALPIDFAVELQPLPVAKFSAIDYSFASLRGQVGGYLRVKGTLREPEIDGRFSAIDFEMSDRTRGTVAAEVSYGGGKAKADLTVCTGPRKMLLASATVPVALDVLKIAEEGTVDISGEIAGHIEGENVRLARLVPRKILEEYISQVEGTMDLDLTFGGTIEKPTLDGTLSVADAKFFIGEFQRGFENVRLDLAARPGELELRDFYVGDRNGYVDAKGTLEVDGYLPRRVDGRMSLEQFATSGFTDFPMFITANVDVGGDFAGGSTEAEATISDLEVVVPDTSTRETHPTQLDADIVVVRENSRSQLDAFEFGGFEGKGTQPYAQLHVIIERNSWVRHPQGQVELMGDISVDLVGTSVRLGGEVETIRGSAEVLGKRFVIEKGLITFTGADPPDPRLQIEAVYELDRSITRAIGQPTSGEPRAIVRVTGRTSNPQIRFLSDPEMPESDVIYTLITNQPPNQQEVGQTQGGALAAGAASGLAAGLLEDKLGEILPFEFDVLRVEAGDRGFADPTVEVGKYIFQDVFFSIEYKVGADPNENTSEFNIEYRFLPRWIFEFTAGNLGTGEANIFWEVY